MANKESTKKKSKKSKKDTKPVPRHVARFWWPLIGTWLAGFIIYGQGARLTDRYWVGLWLVGFALLLFLPVRWQELKLKSKPFHTWWPLVGFLIVMVVMYFQGTRLNDPWGLLWLLSLAMFVAMRYREIGRWFQNLYRRMRKQKAIKVKEPKPEKTSNWWPTVITMLAALVAFVVILPIYLTTPARPFNAASSEETLTQHCVLVSHEIDTISDAIKSNDTATLQRYNLLQKSDKVDISFAENAFSDLGTRLAVCREKGIVSILVG